MFLGDFDRPNLIFEVISKSANFEQAMRDVYSYLPQPLSSSSSSSSSSASTAENRVTCQDAISAGNAIVYCYSQKECVTVSNTLTKMGMCM